MLTRTDFVGVAIIAGFLKCILIIAFPEVSLTTPYLEIVFGGLLGIVIFNLWQEWCDSHGGSPILYGILTIIACSVYFTM